MVPVAIAQVGDALGRIDEIPTEAAKDAFLQLLYAFGLATRPDPEPTPDDDGEWCLEVNR